MSKFFTILYSFLKGYSTVRTTETNDLGHN